MEIAKTVLTCVLASLLIVSVGSAASVTRSFNPTNVAPGGIVEVTLTIDVSGALDYYAIDDMYPSGFSVINDGVGSTEHSGHWKYVVIEDAANTVYKYTLRAPAGTGDYRFTGEYMFGGMQDTVNIAGTNTVYVSAGGTTILADAENPIMTYLPLLAIVAILLFLGFFYFRKKK